MYELIISGEGYVAKTTATNFEDVATELNRHVGKADRSGHILNGTTGEVLMTLKNGNVDYISTETQAKMLGDIAQVDPELAGLLAVMMALAD